MSERILSSVVHYSDSSDDDESGSGRAAQPKARLFSSEPSSNSDIFRHDSEMISEAVPSQVTDSHMDNVSIKLGTEHVSISVIQTDSDDGDIVTPKSDLEAAAPDRKSNEDELD